MKNSITKEQLENDYFVLNLTHQEIAEKYGFKTRQVISRLFNAYGMSPKSKSQLANQNFNKKIEHISKSELEQLYKNNSISQIAKIYGIHRNSVSKLLTKFDIKKTYIKNDLSNDELREEIKIFSLKELSNKYSISTKEIKRRVGEIPEKFYTKEQLLKIISLYDVNSSTFARDIKEDINVYNSIIRLTENHVLQSKKITERIYRIINNIDSNTDFRCKVTGELLKFYTIRKGYGNSNLQISKKGFIWTDNFNLGYSKISQKLFWEIYDKVPDNYKKKIKFSELNYEVKIKVNKQDYEKKICDNKYSYIADFIMENKNIEFDGDYWHSFENIKQKDIKRDKYISSLGYRVLRIKEIDYKTNPEEVVEKCINFLIK